MNPIDEIYYIDIYETRTVMKRRTGADVTREIPPGAIFQLLDDETGPFIITLHTDIEDPYYLSFSTPYTAILDGNGHTIDSTYFVAEGGGDYLIKNLTVQNNMDGETLFQMKGGRLELKNVKANVHKLEKSKNYQDAVGNVASWDWKADKCSKLYVDKDCKFTFSGNNTGTEGKECWAAFSVVGQNYSKVPGYKASLSADWDYMTKIVDTTDNRPTLSFDGRLEYNCELEGNPSAIGYGIYTSGAESLVGPRILVGEHAQIIMNNSPNNIGVHYFSSGSLELYGGFISAPSGITLRGNRLYVPKYSTVEVHAFGAKNQYNPVVASGASGTELNLGNAVTIENFHSGYGTINKTYPAGRTGPLVQIDGGSFSSDYGYAIASYSHSKSTSVMPSGAADCYVRVENFVGPDVVLEGLPSESAYNYITGDNAGWNILKA